MEYLNAKELRNFLLFRQKVHNGVLQAWVNQGTAKVMSPRTHEWACMARGNTDLWQPRCGSSTRLQGVPGYCERPRDTEPYRLPRSAPQTQWFLIVFTLLTQNILTGVSPAQIETIETTTRAILIPKP